MFWIFQLTLIGENGNGNIAHCNWCWCFHSSAILIIIHRCRNGACTCLYHNWIDIFYCIRTHHHRLGHQIYKPTCSPWIFLIFWYFCEVSHLYSCRDQNELGEYEYLPTVYDEYLLMIVYVFSALMSLGLLLDGMFGLEPKWSSNNQPCYKYKVSKLLHDIY